MQGVKQPPAFLEIYMEKHLIKELKAIRDILLPVKDALDDDGLEAYADELHGLLDRIDNLLISVSNQLTTRS